MELSWLETFIALAESSSMRTAASKLGISPATASERISALEDDIGAQLFNRNSKGSELTEAGKLYIDSAKKLISEWNDILSLIKPIDNNPFQQLSLGFPGNVMVPGVGRFLDDFMDRHQEIELSMYNDEQIGIAEGLKSGIVDIFFAFNPADSVARGMQTKLIHKTKLGVLIPSDHRLAFRTTATLADFDGETFVLYPPANDSSMNAFQKKVLKESGIKHIEYGGTFPPTLFTLTVKIGCGVTLLPRVMKRNVPPRSVFLELEDEGCNCGIYMIYDPKNSNPAVKLFVSEFGDQIGVDEQ